MRRLTCTALGVVFFELWHSFGTAMERSIVLNNLK